jgi:hypothetical protein
MRKIPVICLLALMILQGAASFARQHDNGNRRLRLYIECTLYNLCNLDYIRNELPVVDFVQDRFAADVHVLIVSQPAGNGGSAHTVMFIGRGETTRQDTLVFYTQPNATEDENRRLMISQVKMGLMSWLMKTPAASLVDISFRAPASKTDSARATRDKWNGWVFSLGGRLYLNGDKNYHEHNIGLDASVSKITAAYKTSLSFYHSSSRNKYNYTDGTETVTLKTLNEYLYIRHDYIKSLNPRWSAGYQSEYTQSSYDNYKHGYSFAPGIEYNIFPYSISSSKFLAVRYSVEAENRHYIEETLYGKQKEWLVSNEIGVYAAFTQKWGSINGSLNWYNYLHDIAKNNLSLYLDLEVRLIKGLSLNLYTSASIINDQLNISRADADPQEVLLKLKALSTSYNYYTSIGLRYRFGSAFNNVVNPRFTSGRY